MQNRLPYTLLKPAELDVLLDLEEEGAHLVNIQRQFRLRQTPGWDVVVLDTRDAKAFAWSATRLLTETNFNVKDVQTLRSLSARPTFHSPPVGQERVYKLDAVNVVKLEHAVYNLLGVSPRWQTAPLNEAKPPPTTELDRQIEAILGIGPSGRTLFYGVCGVVIRQMAIKMDLAEIPAGLAEAYTPKAPELYEGKLAVEDLRPANSLNRLSIELSHLTYKNNLGPQLFRLRQALSASGLVELISTLPTLSGENLSQNPDRPRVTARVVAQQVGRIIADLCRELGAALQIDTQFSELLGVLKALINKDVALSAYPNVSARLKELLAEDVLVEWAMAASVPGPSTIAEATVLQQAERMTRILHYLTAAGFPPVGRASVEAICVQTVQDTDGRRRYLTAHSAHLLRGDQSAVAHLYHSRKKGVMMTSRPVSQAPVTSLQIAKADLELVMPSESVEAVWLRERATWPSASHGWFLHSTPREITIYLRATMQIIYPRSDGMQIPHYSCSKPPWMSMAQFKRLTSERLTVRNGTTYEASGRVTIDPCVAFYITVGDRRPALKDERGIPTPVHAMWGVRSYELKNGESMIGVPATVNVKIDRTTLPEGGEIQASERPVATQELFDLVSPFGRIVVGTDLDARARRQMLTFRLNGLFMATRPHRDPTETLAAEIARRMHSAVKKRTTEAEVRVAERHGVVISEIETQNDYAILGAAHLAFARARTEAFGLANPDRFGTGLLSRLDSAVVRHFALQCEGENPYSLHNPPVQHQSDTQPAAG